MIKFLLTCTVFFIAVTTQSQSIKMKIASVTPTDGETVLALETSDTTTTNISSGSGGSSGIPRFEVLKIKKSYGTSTNLLFRYSLSGTHLAEVDFEYYDASNTLFYKIVLKDAILGHFSYLSPECSNCSSLTHQVWFDYSAIEVTDIATGNVLRYNRSSRAFY